MPADIVEIPRLGEDFPEGNLEAGEELVATCFLDNA